MGSTVQYFGGGEEGLGEFVGKGDGKGDEMVNFVSSTAPLEEDMDREQFTMFCSREDVVGGQVVSPFVKEIPSA